MTPFQYITLMIFVLICITVTYLNSLHLVKVRKRRDECLIALASLMSTARDLPKEVLTEDFKLAYSLGSYVLRLESLKRD